MALCFTVLALVIFGGIELSRVAMLHHMADHAAYVGARNAIAPGATAQDARDAANAYLDRLNINGADVFVSPDPVTMEDTMLTVSVQIPSAENSWSAPVFMTDSLQGHCQLLTERSPQVLRGNLPEPPPPPTMPGSGGGNTGSSSGGDGDKGGDGPSSGGSSSSGSASSGSSSSGSASSGSSSGGSASGGSASGGSSSSSSASGGSS
ncbi:MAG: TadE family protein, partial [Planctomycetota bacterium]